MVDLYKELGSNPADLLPYKDFLEAFVGFSEKIRLHAGMLPHNVAENIKN